MEYFRKLKLKNILVVDLELTCWENRNDEKFKEVIEIGIVKVDNVNNKIVDKEQYYIKNTLSEITQYCTDLTGISQQILDEKGISYAKACKLIKERFGSKNSIWMAWGCGDYNAIEKNCIKKNIQNPMTTNYINLSEIYGLMNGYARGKSLKKAITANGIEFKGRQHSAIVDAVATAELYLKFFKKALNQ